MYFKAHLHPGGPYSSIPFGGGTFIISNRCGCVKGSSIDSLNRDLTCCIPPIDDHGTCGTSTAIDFIADGFVDRMPCSISEYPTYG